MPRPKKRSRLAQSQRPEGSANFTDGLLANIELLEVDPAYAPSDSEEGMNDMEEDDVNLPDEFCLSSDAGDSDIEILPQPESSTSTGGLRVFRGQNTCKWVNSPVNAWFLEEY